MRFPVFRRGQALPATIVIAFLLFDAAAPFGLARMPELVWVLMAANGVVVAQLWLLAVWTALGPPPWIRRALLALLLSMVSAGLFEHGLIYIAAFGFTPGIRELFLAPLELIALMLPLLVLRGWRGWRLLLADGDVVEGPQRFSLRQLFLATALVAAAVALAQLGVAELSAPDFAVGNLPILSAPDFRRSMVISACVRSLILSLVVVIPLTWLCLRVRLARAVPVLSFLAGTGNGLVFAVMWRYWNGSRLAEGFGGLALVDGVLLTFSGTLLLLRAGGVLRLTDPREGAMSYRS